MKIFSIVHSVTCTFKKQKQKQKKSLLIKLSIYHQYSHLNTLEFSHILLPNTINYLAPQKFFIFVYIYEKF